MARRSRRYVAPVSVRAESYDAALEPGLEKWRSKRDYMVNTYAGNVPDEQAKGGAGFTALVDQIIAGVLDRLGIIGQARIGYYVIGRRLAKLFANYSSAPDDVLRATGMQMIDGYLVREPLVVREAAIALMEELLRRRNELRAAYGIG